MEDHPENIFDKKHRAKYTVVFVILFITAILFSMTPPSNFVQGGVITIATGENLKELSSELANDRYIRSTFEFDSFVMLFGGDARIPIGDYYFEYPKSVIGVAWQITHGIHNLEPIKITIPEGKNSTEIAQIFRSKLASFDINKFEKESKNYEGYLFPETYFVYPRTSAETVLSEMRDMFLRKATPVIKRDNHSGHSASDIVIMASLIEKEAKGDDDRAMIAGILWNRIDRQIPLEVDATDAYANGIPENQLTNTDLTVDSPYNTYIYRGLPPGPISNPGLLALEAAMNPTKTDYLYYIHDKNGNIHYAKTYVEHQQNIKKYLK